MLQRVDPRLRVRAAGMAFATVTLLAFWVIGARELLRQEAERGTDLEAHARIAEQNDVLQRERAQRGPMFMRAIVEYLQRDFHPDRRDNYELARAYLERIGRLEG